MNVYTWELNAGRNGTWTGDMRNKTIGIVVKFQQQITINELGLMYRSDSIVSCQAIIFGKAGRNFIGGSSVVNLSASSVGALTDIKLSTPVTLAANVEYILCFSIRHNTYNPSNVYILINNSDSVGPVSILSKTLTPVAVAGSTGYLYYSSAEGLVPSTYFGAGMMNIRVRAYAPTPTNLNPSGTPGTPSLQETLTPALSWAYSDPDGGIQSWYKITVAKASGGTVYDSDIIYSSANNHIIPAHILEPGIVYYWQVVVTDSEGLMTASVPQYFKMASSPPTISGNANEDLGNKNVPFSINYSVNDADGADVLNVVEKLNGSQINSLSNAPRNTDFTINITKEILDSLPLNQKSTIQISVTDGTATTYKTITFTRVNSGPTISNSDKDLGQVAREGISEKYICHDVEGNTFTILEKVDDIELKNITGVDGTEYTINIPLNIWFALKNGTHTYTITATDSLGASATRTFTFTKKETVIESAGLANIVPTDIAATKILLTPSWLGKENADIILFQVCNNAYDANPTWEDATSQTLLNKPYTFTNTIKTASNWGIDIKFKISLKDGATEGIEFYGIGGSLE